MLVFRLAGWYEYFGDTVPILGYVNQATNIHFRENMKYAFQ
jgi:hypothetical protein